LFIIYVVGHLYCLHAQCRYDTITIRYELQVIKLLESHIRIIRASELIEDIQ